MTTTISNFEEVGSWISEQNPTIVVLPNHTHAISFIKRYLRQTGTGNILQFIIVHRIYNNINNINSIILNNNNNNNNNIDRCNSRCLQSPHCDANCLQHVRSSGQGATVCKSRATHRTLITCNTSSAYHVQHIVCHVVRRDS